MWFDILKIRGRRGGTKTISKEIRRVLRPFIDESVENLIRGRNEIYYSDLQDMISDNKEQYLEITHRELPEESRKTLTRVYNLSTLQLERLARSFLLEKGFSKSEDEVNDAKYARYIRGD